MLTDELLHGVDVLKSMQQRMLLSLLVHYLC